MKTAHIIRRFSFTEWGGTESVVWNSVLNLKAQNAPTEIIATQALCSQAVENRDGIDIRRFPYFYPYFPLNSEQKRTLDKKGGNPCAPQLLNYLKQSDADLFHCHSLGRLAAAVRLAARTRNIPYVISFHGGCFDVPESEMREMLKPTRHTLRYGGLLDRAFRLRVDALNDADGLLCVGANELEPTRARYPGKLVEYLPNGVDVDHFRRKSQFRFRGRQEIPPERKIMLSVSRIDYQKNQLLLPDVLARLLAAGENWQLVLIGPPTSKWYHEKLVAKIHELNLTDRVTLIPGLAPDSQALTAAYQEADVFVLPSLHEPFGIAVLEAWSAGVPVIASPVGGLNHLVEHEKTGLFCAPDDAETLAAQAIRLTSPDHAQFRRQLTCNAGLLVEQNYAWPIITARLLEFYQEAVRRHKSALKYS